MTATMTTPRQNVRSKGVTVPVIRRMTELRRAGLSCPAIKAVVELDYPVSVTVEMVRYYVRRYSGVSVGQGRALGMKHDGAALRNLIAGRPSGPVGNEERGLGTA